MRITIFLSCIVLFFSCKGQPKQSSLVSNTDNNSLLWEVSGNGLKQNSYLFGTFHLMCKGDIVISNQLKAAIGNAATVYMELDMDDPAVMMGGLLMMNMKNGKKLKDLYTEEEYNKLNKFFKDSLSTPLTFLQSIKPYFLVAMLYPKMMPCKTVSGVAEELMKVAKTQQKEINGLETMEFQASVFDSIPYEEQAKELIKSIDSLNIYAKYFDTMVNVYKSQQLAAMQNLFNKSEFGMEEHQDILLDNRNKNWVIQLKEIMKKQPVFVAVGAGHLVGEKGLIELLRNQGYTLRPLMNK
ncbi:MAG: TraB/GumN family protein [Chitinophagaceae bacterium]|nr:TraB/GumN family protein [Chitinophagaceae bacterium]